MQRRPMDQLPPLVIVSGAPGAGKTTLARRLGHDLGLPVLLKDDVKEALSDAMGAPADVAASSRLGDGAYAALATVVLRVLESGVGAVVESNFTRGRSESYLAPLFHLADGVLVHCTAPPDVLARRYRDRFAAGQRHPSHLDGDRHPALLEDLAAGRFEPLALGVPTLVVDTTDGLRPRYAEILAFAARIGTEASV